MACSPSRPGSGSSGWRKTPGATSGSPPKRRAATGWSAGSSSIKRSWAPRDNYASFQPSRATNPSGSGRGLGSRQRFPLAQHAVEDRHQALPRGLVARPPARAVHGLQEPAQRAVHVRHPAPERAVDRVAHPVENVVHYVAMLLQELTPHVRDLIHLLAFHVFRDHESLVFEPLQCGIHCARGRRIAAMQLLFQLFHHLVAVAGFILEQFENDVLHVPRLEPATAAAPRAGPEEAPRPKAEGEPVPCERSAHALPRLAM